MPSNDDKIAEGNKDTGNTNSEVMNADDVQHGDFHVNQNDDIDYDHDSLSGVSGSSSLSKGSTTRKLSKIERKIQRNDLSKRERRLLQNRKSALKCRLKK